MSPLPLSPLVVGTRLVSQRLSLRVRTSRVSRPQDQSAEGKKACVWRLEYYQERHRSFGKRRGTTKHRTLHPRREGRALFAYQTLTRFFRSQVWCGNCRSASRTSSNLRRDARRRFGVVVFGVATRVFFVAFEKKCATCVARRVARLLRVNRIGDAMMVYSGFIGSGESEKDAKCYRTTKKL